MVDYVYSWPTGLKSQEVAGVVVALGVLAEAARIDMNQVAEDELNRCWANVENIRAKQASKRAANVAAEAVEENHGA